MNITAEPSEILYQDNYNSNHRKGINDSPVKPMKLQDILAYNTKADQKGPAQNQIQMESQASNGGANVQVTMAST